MAKRRAKKSMYWHQSAKVLLEHGLTPSEVAKAIKTVFPHTVVTGRHIGAYKRRLVGDNMLEKNLPKTINMQEAYSMMHGIISDEDSFIYRCTVGSAKRTLKCFEYKLTQQAIEPKEDIDKWLSSMTHITQT